MQRIIIVRNGKGKSVFRKMLVVFCLPGAIHRSRFIRKTFEFTSVNLQNLLTFHINCLLNFSAFDHKTNETFLEPTQSAEQITAQH